MEQECTIQSTFVNEITPLQSEDFFYLVDRKKKNFDFPIHYHSEYEINFIERGAGLRRIVGDSEEVISDYELVLITGDRLEHAWQQDEDVSNRDIHEITIQFSPEILPETLLKRTQFDSIRTMILRAQRGLAFSLKTIMQVYPDLMELAKESRGFESVARFMRLLYILSQAPDARELSSSSFAQADTGGESRRVKKVQDYLSQHYNGEVRMTDVANLVGMTPEGFSRFFKLRTGTTFSTYLVEYRLGIATRMLIDTVEPISIICFSCGFNTLSNFNRLFRASKGCTPSEFRDRFHKKRIRV